MVFRRQGHHLDAGKTPDQALPLRADVLRSTRSRSRVVHLAEGHRQADPATGCDCADTDPRGHRDSHGADTRPDHRIIHNSDACLRSRITYNDIGSRDVRNADTHPRSCSLHSADTCSRDAHIHRPSPT
eukprot:PhM_4_TR17416/c3_g6_i1/m.82281